MANEEYTYAPFPKTLEIWFSNFPISKIIRIYILTANLLQVPSPHLSTWLERIIFEIATFGRNSSALVDLKMPVDI